jgi:hypothetical protein
MRFFTGLLLAACGIGAVCLARDRDDRWPVRAQEDIEKALPLSGFPFRLVVDNIEGYVHVTGTNSSTVQVKAHKVIRAESDADVAEAQRDVKLDISSKPGTVSVYYDAPWRCNGENGGCHNNERRFYSVLFDIDVQVPREAKAYVSTVNRGDIQLNNTTGNFEVKDINGPIAIKAVSGSGEVHTINGPIDVEFSGNPKEATSFKTINGTVNVTFQPGLSANLSFKTFNGQIFSDFDVTALARPISQPERADGRFVYRSNREHGARVGQGGPELRFETLNGNVNLRTASGANHHD